MVWSRPAEGALTSGERWPYAHAPSQPLASVTTTEGGPPQNATTFLRLPLTPRVIAVRTVRRAEAKTATARELHVVHAPRGVGEPRPATVADRPASAC